MKAEIPLPKRKGNDREEIFFIFSLERGGLYPMHLIFHPSSFILHTFFGHNIRAILTLIMPE
jgi:hypothetical protein